MIKLIILGLASYLIYERIWVQGAFDLLLHMSFLGTPEGIGLMCTVLVLGCANWVLEGMKWRSLVSSRTPLTFIESARQSFASLTVSLVTPNRLGEYGAKIAYYPRNDRKHILLFNFLGNMSQLSMTLFFGAIGIFSIEYLAELGLSDLLSENHLLIFIGLTVIVLAMALPIFNRLSTRLGVSPPLTRRAWTTLFGLSFLKYLAFSHQFFFMLLLFGADMSYAVIMATLFLVYLIASAIPGFLLFDWMVKGSVAVTLFGSIGLNEMLVLSVTSLMWVMNFGVPSMIGAYHVMRFRKVDCKEVKMASP